LTATNGNIIALEAHGCVPPTGPEGAGDRIQGEVQQDVARRAASKAPGARAVVAMQTPNETVPVLVDELDDALATLLPPNAEATVSYVDQAQKKMFGRATWVVRLRILEGDHAGRLISWWLRALPHGAKRVARGSSICTSFAAATGLRPPRDLARRRPSYWLADSQYRVSTRQVVRDVHGVARAETASYSVVVAILARVAGVSPALRERTR